MAAVCPFSGEPIAFAKFGDSWIATSPWGWQSKLFARASEVREWAAKMNPAPSTIVEHDRTGRFSVRGNGWYSESFQFREQAEFWRSHRDGKPMEGAKRPTKIEVVGVREPPPEDPAADAVDLVNAARACIAEEQARKDREEKTA